jgi:hypothetical protein
VLHDSGKVDEPKVNELATFALHKGQYFFRGAFLHGSSCRGARRGLLSTLIDVDITPRATALPR